MAKHYRKGGNQDLALKLILLITAILNLVNTLIESIRRMTG
jgi:hypothetical protein|nr:MAG TPA: Minor nucleoprotein VP30, VP30, SSGCID, Seattle Structural.25A [Caudoviricetes sp.]